MAFSFSLQKSYFKIDDGAYNVCNLRQALFQQSPRAYEINSSKIKVDDENSFVQIPVSDSCGCNSFVVIGEWQKNGTAINFTGTLPDDCKCTLESVKKFYSHGRANSS
jgi:hypothetical protein